MCDYVTAHPGLRVLESPFMEIRQAVGTPRSRSAETVTYLGTFVESLKAEGFIAAALQRSGRRTRWRLAHQPRSGAMIT